MNIFIALLLLAIAFIAFVFFYTNPQPKSLLSTDQLELRPYVSKNPLTPTEATFYHRLIEALPDYIVLAQVQLSSFLKVDQTQTNYQNYLKWFQPISQQSVDYLICEKDFSIIAAVELDDKSHYGAKSIERDAKKNNNLNAANVPLIRWHAEDMPEIVTIKQSILKYASDNVAKTSIEPVWLADGDTAFFSNPPNPTKSILVNISLWFAIAMVIMATINIIKSNISSFTKPQISKFQTTTSPESTQSSNGRSLSTLERQQQERIVHERERMQAQQVVIQQQNEQRQLQAREAALKNEAWERYYKDKTVECTATEDMVTCGNKYIRNREKFEKYWETQRSNLR